jgi:hypothetical protein
MLTMCVELSRDASIQFRIESRSVVPCGIGLLKILSILELGVTKVLLKSGHVERMESNDTQKPAGTGTANQQDLNGPTASMLDRQLPPVSTRAVVPTHV